MNPAVQRLLVITASIAAFSSAVPLREDGFENGEAQHLTPPFNPELGSLREGDIMLSPKKPRWSRNAVIDRRARWPNATVPYEMSDTLSSYHKERLHATFAEFQKHTCVRFVPRTSQPDYIYIQGEGSFCWSTVGRRGGRQEVNLPSPCLIQKGSPIHELMHILGFWHEQNRPDRDAFITIRDENIEHRYEKNFVKAMQTETFNVPYDFGSVMHYSSQAFSANGKPTIEAKPKFRGKTSAMGQRSYFSVSDVAKINKMYCGDAPDPQPSDPELSESSHHRLQQASFPNASLQQIIHTLGLMRLLGKYR